MGLDDGAGGEAAKAGEDEAGALGLPPEAGGPPGPVRRGGEGGEGVQVAGDGQAVGSGVGRVVDEVEGGAPEGVADEGDAAAGRGKGEAAVVVADDEGKRDGGVRGAPLFDEVEDGGGLGGGGVKEIAAEDDFLGSAAEDGAGEAGEVVGGVAFGDGEAVVAEVGRFAEVEVGEEEDFGLAPESAALGEEIEGLAAEGEGGGHGAWRPPPMREGWKWARRMAWPG